MSRLPACRDHPWLLCQRLRLHSRLPPRSRPGYLEGLLRRLLRSHPGYPEARSLRSHPGYPEGPPPLLRLVSPECLEGLSHPLLPEYLEALLPRSGLLLPEYPAALLRRLLRSRLGYLEGLSGRLCPLGCRLSFLCLRCRCIRSSIYPKLSCVPRFCFVYYYMPPRCVLTMSRRLRRRRHQHGEDRRSVQNSALPRGGRHRICGGLKAAAPLCFLRRL